MVANNNDSNIHVRKRLFYLDIIRVIAVFLVMYGHFVSVGMFAKTIPFIINDKYNATLPLLKENFLFDFEIFIIENFHTQLGVIGVSLFFLVTGYLMPVMLEKYSRIQFFINRFFRIFPVLIVSTFFTGLLLYFTQDITFSFFSYFTTLTLSYEIFQSIPLIPVLWTLVIEYLFYITCFSLGKFSLKKVIFINIAILVICTLVIFFKVSFLYNFVNNIKFINFITIGSYLYFLDKTNSALKIKYLICFSVLFSFFVFQLCDSIVTHIANYSMFSNHFLSVSIFLIIRALFENNCINVHFVNIIKKLADLVYPIYLLHVQFGIVFIYFARDYIHSKTVIILCTYGLCVILSYVTHKYIENKGISFGRKINKRIA